MALRRADEHGFRQARDAQTAKTNGCSEPPVEARVRQSSLPTLC